MHKLKVFLTEDALVDLEDDYVDKGDELREFMFGNIKVLAKQAKMIVRSKQFMATAIDEDGKQEQKAIKLKEFDLKKFTLDSDETWIPENLDVDDCKPYVIKVGPKTIGRLETYVQVYNARVSIYNKSLKNSNQKLEEAKPAKCFEQIIHEQLIGPVLDKLGKLDDRELDEEFEEINNPKSKKKPNRTGKKE